MIFNCSIRNFKNYLISNCKCFFFDYLFWRSWILNYSILTLWILNRAILNIWVRNTKTLKIPLFNCKFWNASYWLFHFKTYLLWKYTYYTFIFILKNYLILKHSKLNLRLVNFELFLFKIVQYWTFWLYTLLFDFQLRSNVIFHSKPKIFQLIRLQFEIWVAGKMFLKQKITENLFSYLSSRPIYIL